MTTIRNKIINLAISEVGYTETGKNITKYSEYFDTPKAKGGAWEWFCSKKQGVEWCSIFQCYLICKVITPEAALKFLGLPKPEYNYAASCKYFYKYLKAKGYEIDKTKGGKADLIFFNEFSHIGVIEETVSGYYHTIEGNKNNAVRRCKYPISSSAISAVIHLPYETIDGSSVPDDPKPEPEQKKDRYKVKTNTGVPLRLRKEPTTKSEILTLIPNKTIIEVDASKGKWKHTTFDGYSGWCYDTYLVKL